jgi:hypothetical protein
MNAVRRSASILRTKWGEALVSEGTIGVVVLAALVPIGVVAGIVGATGGATAAAVVAGLLIGTLLFVSNTLDAIVGVALYRYAVDGVTVGGFSSTDLDRSFRLKG